MSSSAPALAVELLPREALAELGSEWDELLPRSYDNRIFLSHSWHELWWRHFDTDPTTVVTCRGEQGVLLGVLALREATVDGQRVLTLGTDPSVTDYVDAIADKQRAESVLETLWDVVLRDLQPERVQVRHVPSASPMLSVLREVGPRHGLVTAVEDDEVCPVAILCPTWDGYLQMLNKKQRHEIRRKLRRAQEGAEWSWRTARTQEDLDKDLPVFFRLHEKSGRDKARFMNDAMREYFCDMAAEYLRQGCLRLCVFQRDGIDIAATMGFSVRGRYLLYNSGYDPAFSANSPGIAAVALAMQDAINDGAAAFDFLSGDEPYKYQFGASNTHTCKATVARR